MEIKKAEDSDIAEIIDIWYEVSLQAHCFIPADYWKANKQLMKEKYLPTAETFVAVNGEKISGFISLVDDYLAAIFIRPELQGKGIGSALLNYVKKNHNTLQLNVFCKNRKSIEFYKSKGFVIISESENEETGENEFVMKWKQSFNTE